MALTSDERRALPDSHFAVPGKRKLPIHDEAHVSMAWKEVDRTQGLSDGERSIARRRIMERANELGMDTSEWHTLKSATFEAMALEVPEVKDHPNRMPFSGVLVWLDEPSDSPPGGSGGRRVIVTKDAAEKAIPSLLGMGVNYTENLTGHDAQKKIGIMTEAWIESEGKRSGIFIKGFIYASDFPDAAARIRADKDILGFSFEAGKIKLADPGADPLVVTECVFTGAAILRKDRAAYETTKLAAQASASKGLDMNPEELKAFLAEAMKPTSDALVSITGRLDKIEAGAKEDPKKLEAANLLHMVEPHAKALEAAADGMCAAGIGGHETHGHAVMARKMAAHLRASAATGSLPHLYRDHDFFAAADKGNKGEADIKAIVEAAVKPLADAQAATGTIVKDLQAKAFTAAAEPGRKTIPAETLALLDKYGLKAEGDKKLTAAAVDAALDAAKVTNSTERMAAKLRLQKDGLLAA